LYQSRLFVQISQQQLSRLVAFFRTQELKMSETVSV